MAIARTVIAGGTVVSPLGQTVCDVLVEDGVIQGLGDVDRSGAGALDASGCLVLPGAIDVHTHVFGRIRDDTRSALRGGTTSLSPSSTRCPASGPPRPHGGRWPTSCPSR
jgi:dihydroorotase-like cyclic amidohydrolase